VGPGARARGRRSVSAERLVKTDRIRRTVAGGQGGEGMAGGKMARRGWGSTGLRRRPWRLVRTAGPSVGAATAT